MSFLKCSQCDTFVSVFGHLEGMEEHVRLVHQSRRPSITSQLRTTAGLRIREEEGLANAPQTSNANPEAESLSERHNQELEELAKRQEQFVVRVVQENKEQEERAVRMQKEMVDKLRRSEQEREEKLERDREERNVKQREQQRRERSQRRKELQLEYDEKIEQLKASLESKFKKENEEAEEYLEWEKKVWEDAQMESLKGEKERGEIQLKRKGEELIEEKRKRTWNLSQLLIGHEAQRNDMLEKQEKEMRSTTRKRKREAVELEEERSKQPSPPECPVCFNEMAPPTKIFQCSNGHHICETCKDQLDPFKCPKCRKRMIGRATDMENFLLLFCPAENQTEID